MLRPITAASQHVLDKLAAAPRVGAVPFEWTLGWMEAEARADGYYTASSAVPTSLDEVILQGPHFTVATPYAKQPNVTMRNNLDYSVWDLEGLGERPIPRTSYQRAKPMEAYLAGYQHWDGVNANAYWRLAWRNMVDSSTVRSLHAALLPPGPTPMPVT